MKSSKAKIVAKTHFDGKKLKPPTVHNTAVLGGEMTLEGEAGKRCIAYGAQKHI